MLIVEMLGNMTAGMMIELGTMTARRTGYGANMDYVSAKGNAVQPVN